MNSIVEGSRSGELFLDVGAVVRLDRRLVLLVRGALEIRELLRRVLLDASGLCELLAAFGAERGHLGLLRCDLLRALRQVLAGGRGGRALVRRVRDGSEGAGRRGGRGELRSLLERRRAGLRRRALGRGGRGSDGAERPAAGGSGRFRRASSRRSGYGGDRRRLRRGAFRLRRRILRLG